LGTRSIRRSRIVPADETLRGDVLTREPSEVLLENNGLKILDVQMNSVNGGSFAVTAALQSSPLKPNQTIINWLLEEEHRMGLMTPRPFRQFEERVFEHRHNLIQLVRALNADGKKIFGYGASTKGNVLLQYCGLTGKDIPYIGEVNSDKFGSYTPGTWIPIIPEAELLAMKPDYLIVLPWHFRKFFEGNQRYSNCKLVFPLPELSY